MRLKMIDECDEFHTTGLADNRFSWLSKNQENKENNESCKEWSFVIYDI